MSDGYTMGVRGRSTSKAMTDDEAAALKHRLGIAAASPTTAKAMAAMHRAATRAATDPDPEPDDGPEPV